MSNTIVDFIIARNREQSEKFVSKEAVLERRNYRALHPTEIAVFKCMDGRIDFPLMTDIPLGIVQPFRNVGGIFDLDWPFFGGVVREWTYGVESRHHVCLAVITYHFSKGDPKRGCAGHNYHTEAARKAAMKLRDQFTSVFGKDRHFLYPIVIGIETDEESFILHGNGGEILDLDTETELSDNKIFQKIRFMFPGMKLQVMCDIVPLLAGNIRHIKEIRASGRPISDTEHREQILAVGRGYDWIHLYNKAIIVGPFSYDLGKPISTAAKLLVSNLRSGRIPKNEGALLLCVSSYSAENASEKEVAVKQARSFAEYALNVIENEEPELISDLEIMVGVVETNTRKLERIDILSNT